MLPIIIAVGVIIAAVVLWFISIQHRLVALDEDINNAMCQIGVQLSSQFDALIAILNLTKGYAKNESEMLIESVKFRRILITAKSTSGDVLCQEGIIFEVLKKIVLISERYPGLKTDKNYIKTMDAIETFKNMVRTSRLLYNNGVTKLNRDIRRFPVCMVACMFGFSPRDYLEDYTTRVKQEISW